MALATLFMNARNPLIPYRVKEHAPSSGDWRPACLRPVQPCPEARSHGGLKTGFADNIAQLFPFQHVEFIAAYQLVHNYFRQAGTIRGGAAGGKIHHRDGRQ